MFRYKQINGIYHWGIKSNSSLNNPNYNYQEFTYFDNIINNNNDHKVDYSLGIEAQEMLDSTNQVQLHKELFWESTSNTRLLYSLNTEYIDFRYVEFEKMSEPYTLTIINNSNKKMLVKWLLEESEELNNIRLYKNDVNKTNPKLLKEIQNKQNKEKKLHFLGSNDSNINRKNCIYNVLPEEALISARNKFEFKVYFTPTKSECYFFSYITCLGYIINDKQDLTSNSNLNNSKNSINYNVKKNLDNQNQIKAIKGLISNSALQMINKSHVESISKGNKNKNLNDVFLKTVGSNNSTLKKYASNLLIEPPIPLKLPVIGHSFPPSCQIYIPMAEVTPKKELNFAYTSVNESQYNTFTIKNTTDTPLYFKFIPDVSNVFRVYPKTGIIEPKEFMLINCEFNPKEPNIYKHPLKIIFNHDSNNMYNLNLQGVCCDPDIKINNNKTEIYYPPSYIGIKTSRSISIVNNTPIKINVDIQILKSRRIIIKRTNNKKNIRLTNVNKNESIGIVNNNDTSLDNNNDNEVKMEDDDIEEFNEDDYNEMNNNNIDNDASLANVSVDPSYFELEPFQFKKIKICVTPLQILNFETLIQAKCWRDYSPLNDIKGVFNPGNINNYLSVNNSNDNYYKSKKQTDNSSIVINDNVKNIKENKLKLSLDGADVLQGLDRRERTYTFKVIGSGSDGELKISPKEIAFGTVKVGFQEKKYFSIYNTSICNFYIQLMFKDYESTEINDNSILHNKNINYNSIFKLDFKEGLIHSLCKKTVSITYKPNTRNLIKASIVVNAIEYKTNTMYKSLKNTENKNKSSFSPNKHAKMNSLAHTSNNSLAIPKATAIISANGDYPIIEIVDIRNNNKSTDSLWNDFNVQSANAELNKELSEQEINFINLEKTNKKIQDYYEKLNIVTFDFGTHLLKKDSTSRFQSLPNNINLNYNANVVYNQSNNQPQHFDVYITFKNIGGVDSEFYFKFPDDINIKREIWMDPDEPTSEGTKEYNVLKLKIFEIYPRSYKLKKGEYCNVRFRYNIKEEKEHSLRVIFQIVNGKPLVFELKAHTKHDKEGILHVKNNIVDFGNVPIGNMNPMNSIFELSNIGGIKLKYKINVKKIEEYNSLFYNFPIFEIDDVEGNISQNDSKYIVVKFKPLTEMEYKLVVPIEFWDDVNFNIDNSNNNNNNNNNNNININKNVNVNKLKTSCLIKYIELIGVGFHKVNVKNKEILLNRCGSTNKNNYYNPKISNLPISIVYNKYENVPIYKCGLSVDEINFGVVKESEQAIQTFIMYNFSSDCEITFNLRNQTNNLIHFDKLDFEPEHGTIPANGHCIIKASLFCYVNMMSYTRDIIIKVTSKREDINFNNMSNNAIYQEKQDLHLRVIKRACIADNNNNNVSGKLETNVNGNSNFIEHMLVDWVKDILCSNSLSDHLEKTLDNQFPVLYDWTTDTKCDDQASIRKKFIDYWIEESNKNAIDNSAFVYNNGTLNKKSVKNNRINSKTINSIGANLHKKASSIINDEQDSNNDNKVEEDIEEKYTKELASKFNYSTNELDEKLLMVNDDTKKLVFRILENTVYNIMSEAVNNECDLTEPTKIFFIKKS